MAKQADVKNTTKTHQTGNLIRFPLNKAKSDQGATAAYGLQLFQGLDQPKFDRENLAADVRILREKLRALALLTGLRLDTGDWRARATADYMYASIVSDVEAVAAILDGVCKNEQKKLTRKAAKKARKLAAR